MSPEAEAEAVEVGLVLEAINARYGYDLRGYAPASIARRVQASLARTGVAHLGELQHRIVHDPGFFASVLQDLTVRTSEMFRDPGCFLAFRTRVVPLLRTYPVIKVWHAGCSSGEEAYSMAILLREEGLGSRAQIYATDLNPQAIEDAKEGVYPVRRLEKFEDNYRRAGGTEALTSYCTEAFEGMAMHQSLRSNIHFFQHGLVSDQVFGEVHVVFCRNVLLYFGSELRQRALRKLFESLCPGGFLILGKSERLDPAGLALGFTEHELAARIYRRGL